MIFKDEFLRRGFQYLLELLEKEIMKWLSTEPSKSTLKKILLRLFEAIGLWKVSKIFDDQIVSMLIMVGYIILRRDLLISEGISHAIRIVFGYLTQVDWAGHIKKILNAIYDGIKWMNRSLTSFFGWLFRGVYNLTSWVVGAIQNLFQFVPNRAQDEDEWFNAPAAPRARLHMNSAKFALWA